LARLCQRHGVGLALREHHPARGAAGVAPTPVADGHPGFFDGEHEALPLGNVGDDVVDGESRHGLPRVPQGGRSSTTRNEAFATATRGPLGSMIGSTAPLGLEDTRMPVRPLGRFRSLSSSKGAPLPIAPRIRAWRHGFSGWSWLSLDLDHNDWRAY